MRDRDPDTDKPLGAEGDAAASKEKMPLERSSIASWRCRRSPKAGNPISGIGSVNANHKNSLNFRSGLRTVRL